MSSLVRRFEVLVSPRLNDVADEPAVRRVQGARFQQLVVPPKRGIVSDLSALQRRRGQRSFAQWDEFVPPQLVAQSEEVVGQLIDRLIALGATPSREQVRTEVAVCVQRFNELDATVANSWIFTIEREDIGEVIWGLVDLCGFDGGEDWLSGRDW
jgi:hypothetical protein